MAERHRAAIVAIDRLGVVPAAATGGRVADVAEGEVSRERLEAALVEHLGDEAEIALGGDVPVLGGRDAGRLLAAVLEGVEGEVGEPGDVVLGCVDAEHTAFVARAVAELWICGFH